MPRKPVNIPDDTWLEALKFLTCRQWSKNRYLCRQINGIVERNHSRLPKTVLARAEMYYKSETDHLPYLLKGLTRNVRAETLTISLKCDSLKCALLADFLLDPSGAKECAGKKVKINVSSPVQFLSVLIEKFRASPLVKCASIPTIEFLYPCHDDVWEYLGANSNDQEVVSLGGNALYTVSNGQNRMRIVLCKSRLPDRYYCNIKIDSI